MTLVPEDRTRLDGLSDPTRLDASDATRVDASDGWGVTTSLPPKLADRYEVVRSLPAVGGEADLWVVRERAAGVLRVLKVYRVGVSPKVGVLERLGGALGEFVVQLFEHAVVGGRAFEVLEFVEFGSMRDVFPAGVVVGDEVLLRVVRALVDALSHVHDLGVVHRDLKPGNVLVRSMDPLTLVLADFGIASASEGTMHFTGRARTITYAAPEALVGAVSSATDYWSLGMMIAELASGRHPWGGLDPRVIEGHLSTVDVPLAGVREPWLGLCEGLLQRDPRARWGRIEVRRYLAGDTTLPRVRRDTARSGGTPLVATAASHARPYRFEGVEYTTPHELAEAFVQKPAAAVRHLERGFVFKWLTDDVHDNDLAVAIHDLLDAHIDEHTLILGATTTLSSARIAGYAGRTVNRDTLRTTAEAALAGDAPASAWLARLSDAFGGAQPILDRVRDAIVGASRRDSIPERLDAIRERLTEANLGFTWLENVAVPPTEGFIGTAQGTRVLMLAGETSSITPSLARAAGKQDVAAAWLITSTMHTASILTRTIPVSNFERWNLIEPLTTWGKRVAEFHHAWRHPSFQVIGDSGRAEDFWITRARALLLLSTLDESYAQGVLAEARNRAERAQSTFNTQEVWTITAADQIVAAAAFILKCALEDAITQVWSEARRIRTLHLAMGPVHSVSFSPDGRLLASRSSDGTVRVWDTVVGDCVRTLEEHSGEANPVVFSPDSRFLATSGSGSTTVRVWDALSGRCERALEGHSKEISSVVFSPDGSFLASGSDDETVRVWDAVSGACIRMLEGHTKNVSSVVFSPDSRFLASSSGDATVRVWDAVSGACVRTFEGHKRPVESVVFSPDGRFLASGSLDNTIRVWDVVLGAHVWTRQWRSRRRHSLVFSRDGRFLAACSGSNAVGVWDTRSGAETDWLGTFRGRILSAAFNSDGGLIAGGVTGLEESETFVVLSDGHMNDLRLVEPRRLGSHSDCVNSVVFSPDGLNLASSSSDATIELWNVASGRWLKTLEGHSRSVESLAVSPDGRILASSSRDEMVHVWDAVSDTCIQTLEGHERRVSSVAFSPDGRFLASGSEDETIRVWDTVSGECGRTLEGHSETVNSVAFSSDGDYLASGSDDQTIRLWDAVSGACVRILEGHSDAVNSVAFSPDGRFLASGSWDETVRVWVASSGACFRTLKAHSSWVNSVGWSPDGRFLATGWGDATIRVWDTVSGACSLTLKGHTKAVSSVAYSPNGRFLASSSGDRTVRVWDVVSGACVSTLEGHAFGANYVTFCSDGRTLVSADYLNVLLWGHPQTSENRKQGTRNSGKNEIHA